MQGTLQGFCNITSECDKAGGAPKKSWLAFIFFIFLVFKVVIVVMAQTLKILTPMQEVVG